MNKILIMLVLYAFNFYAPSAVADLGSIGQIVGGVESDTKGQIADVNNRTLTVFKQLGIQSTGLDTENSGAKQILKGKKDDMEIEVQLTPTPGAENQTHIVVTAKQGTIKWNKDFAQQILSKIIQAA